MTTKTTIRCTNDRTDGYWPAMKYRVRITRGEDQFIYNYELIDDALVLVKAAASNMDLDHEMRQLAFKRALEHFRRKFDEFQAAVEAGVWD